MTIKDYKPITHIVSDEEAHLEIRIPMQKCSQCSIWMISNKVCDAARDVSPWYEADVWTQVGRANHEIMSEALKNGKRICTRCVYDSKRDVFVCRICGNSTSYKYVKYIFGEFEYCFCVFCYDEMPAKQWNEMVELLSKEIR